METTVETTTAKINTRPIKDLIKTYVDKQKLYKDQRKSKKNKLERTIDPKEAQYKALWNSVELRILYAAYGLLRGKSLSQVESNYSETDSDNFLNQHKAKIAKTLEGMQQMSKIKE
jgi:hypothetical protein